MPQARHAALARAKCQQVDELGVMDNLRALGVRKPGAESRQRLSFSTEPRRARHSRLRRKLHGHRAAAEALRFAFSGGQVEPQGNLLLTPERGEKVMHGLWRFELRVVGAL